ncbi:MAG: hypothetical protein AB7E81_20135 [Hyphomicrobiaceae bacterium]
MNKRKLSLKIEEWPARDRLALETAFAEGADLFDGAGLAVRWRPPTRAKVKKSYGAFLHCLKRHDLLDMTAGPSDRFSRPNILLFVQDMRDRAVASTSIASAMRDVREAMRVMCDGKRHEDLIQASRALDRSAVPSRDQRDQLVAPSTLFYAGVRRMKRLKALAATDLSASVNFGDGLMMSMEAIKALRLRNLSEMMIDHNITCNQLDEYELRYEPHETKTKVRIRAPLPDKLAPYIQYWLSTVRPNLLRGRVSQAMWITTWSTDMAPITLYYRFCKATKDETGKRINPHLTRKIIVTGLAIGAPELISLASIALDHLNRRHTRDAYDLSDDLAASRAANAVIAQRRAAAIKKR